MPWQVLHADFNNANVILKDLKEDERLEKEAEWREQKKQERQERNAQGNKQHDDDDEYNKERKGKSKGNKRNKSRRDRKPYHQADWVVNGVVDVGDIVYSCRVNDIAIGIAYMLIAAISDTKEAGG